MSNKGLLTLIVVILLGIFTVVIIDATQKSPAEEMADNLGNLTEDVGSAIKDNAR